MAIGTNADERRRMRLQKLETTQDHEAQQHIESEMLATKQEEERKRKEAEAALEEEAKQKKQVEEASQARIQSGQNDSTEDFEETSFKNATSLNESFVNGKKVFKSSNPNEGGVEEGYNEKLGYKYTIKPGKGTDNPKRVYQIKIPRLNEDGTHSKSFETIYLNRDGELIYHNEGDKSLKSQIDQGWLDGLGRVKRKSQEHSAAEQGATEKTPPLSKTSGAEKYSIDDIEKILKFKNKEGKKYTIEEVRNLAKLREQRLAEWAKQGPERRTKKEQERIAAIEPLTVTDLQKKEYFIEANLKERIEAFEHFRGVSQGVRQNTANIDRIFDEGFLEAAGKAGNAVALRMLAEKALQGKVINDAQKAALDKGLEALVETRDIPVTRLLNAASATTSPNYIANVQRTLEALEQKQQGIAATHQALETLGSTTKPDYDNIKLNQSLEFLIASRDIEATNLAKHTNAAPSDHYIADVQKAQNALNKKQKAIAAIHKSATTLGVTTELAYDNTKLNKSLESLIASREVEVHNLEKATQAVYSDHYITDVQKAQEALKQKQQEIEAIHKDLTALGATTKLEYNNTKLNQALKEFAEKGDKFWEKSPIDIAGKKAIFDKATTSLKEKDKEINKVNSLLEGTIAIDLSLGSISLKQTSLSVELTLLDIATAQSNYEHTQSTLKRKATAHNSTKVKLLEIPTTIAKKEKEIAQAEAELAILQKYHRIVNEIDAKNVMLGKTPPPENSAELSSKLKALKSQKDTLVDTTPTLPNIDTKALQAEYLAAIPGEKNNLKRLKENQTIWTEELRTIESEMQDLTNTKIPGAKEKLNSYDKQISSLLPKDKKTLEAYAKQGLSALAHSIEKKQTELTQLGDEQQQLQRKKAEKANDPKKAHALAEKMREVIIARRLSSLKKDTDNKTRDQEIVTIKAIEAIRTNTSMTYSQQEEAIIVELEKQNKSKIEAIDPSKTAEQKEIAKQDILEEARSKHPLEAIRSQHPDEEEKAKQNLEMVLEIYRQPQALNKDKAETSLATEIGRLETIHNNVKEVINNFSSIGADMSYTIPPAVQELSDRVIATLKGLVFIKETNSTTLSEASNYTNFTQAMSPPKKAEVIIPKKEKTTLTFSMNHIKLHDKIDTYENKLAPEIKAALKKSSREEDSTETKHARANLQYMILQQGIEEVQKLKHIKENLNRENLECPSFDAYIKAVVSHYQGKAKTRTKFHEDKNAMQWNILVKKHEKSTPLMPMITKEEAVTRVLETLIQAQNGTPENYLNIHKKGKPTEKMAKLDTIIAGVEGKGTGKGKAEPTQEEKIALIQEMIIKAKKEALDNIFAKMNLPKALKVLYEELKAAGGEELEEKKGDREKEIEDAIQKHKKTIKVLGGNPDLKIEDTDHPRIKEAKAHIAALTLEKAALEAGVVKKKDKEESHEAEKGSKTPHKTPPVTGKGGGRGLPL